MTPKQLEQWAGRRSSRGRESLPWHLARAAGDGSCPPVDVCALSARKGCAERLFIVSLFQTGGSRATNLGHPAHPRSKDTGDHNLPEKRGQAKSASRTPRKTRVVGPRLHCFKSNPD